MSLVIDQSAGYPSLRLSSRKDIPTGATGGSGIPVVGRRPVTKDFGVSGTQIQAGIITGEEYNPDLAWREAIRTYDVMRRSDAQIFSTLLICELPIRSAEWKIAPGTSDPADLEVASFAETNLFHTMARPFDDVLRHALMELAYGFMVMEQTFKVENGQTLLRDLAPRLPRTIQRWWTDDDNQLVGIQQWAYRGQRIEYIDIPVESLVIFTNRQEGQNYEGVSLLRSAYKSWWYKQNYERIQAVGFEREHIGIPVITLPPGYTDKDLANAQKIGKNIRAHESAFITIPSEWSVEWLKGKGGERKGSTLLETMYYLDRQIQQNVLAQFLSLGTTDVGSYAMSNDQSRVFLMSLQSVARQIASVLNRSTIKKLIDYNYPNVQVYPELISQKIHAYNFMDLTTAITQLAGIGALPITPELEDYIHDMLGVPAAPRSVVESTNPTARQGRQQEINARRAAIIGPRHIGEPGEDKNESSGGVGMNEVYETARYRLMTGPQRAIYERMATDAGRPRITIRLGAPHEWVSALTDLHASRTARRTVASDVAVTAMRRAVADLTSELEDALTGENE